MTQPILIVDEQGLPVGFLDPNAINERAEVLAKEIVLAACVDNDLDKARELTIEHLAGIGRDDKQAYSTALTTIYYLAAALQEMAGAIRNPKEG